MTLNERLVFKGYFPENLPPSFTTSDIADYIVDNPKSEWWSGTRNTVRPANYNASKRGSTRRVFSVVHPRTMRDMAKFISSRWDDIKSFADSTDGSLSTPRICENGDRAIEIDTHGTVESEKISRLSEYRFIAKTDISRFYHSIYTHSVPWAFHGKSPAKNDRDVKSDKIYFNRADAILRFGQDGQTIGIPVGPDTSRIIAEIIAVAIDKEFKRRCDVAKITSIRHVDDVWIGAHSHDEVERALGRYREALREFELDINESKTRIYATDFQFTDLWPTDLSLAIDAALNSAPGQKSERLRTALERAFILAVANNDDSILKYVIRYLDRNSNWVEWDVYEPFLKRAIVHFGHTADYVTRVIVWRQFAKGDLNVSAWNRILQSTIGAHGRIGNDSEVCWALYACLKLDVSVPIEVAEAVIQNCGALSVVSALHSAEAGLLEAAIFDSAYDRLKRESSKGPFWPALMEWKSRKWPRHAKLTLDDEVINALAKNEALIYDSEVLPTVFQELENEQFSNVMRAIEDRPSMYDESPTESDDDEFPWDREPAF